MSEEQALEKIDQLLSQFATEIVLTEPNNSAGQLPLRDILFTLQGSTAGNDEYSDFYAIATEAINRIDALLDVLKDFSEEDIIFLNECLGKLKNLLRIKKGLEPDEGFVSPSNEGATSPTEMPAIGAPGGEPQEETSPDTSAFEQNPVDANPFPEEKVEEGNPFEQNPVSTSPEPAPSPEPPEPEAPAATEPEEPQEEPVLEFDPDEDQELIVEFINEANEHLQNIELGVLELETNPKNEETLASIFRAFHTFKGTSGFLNLVPIKNLAHELESLLDLARTNQLDITQREIEVILKGGDTLREFVTEIEAQINGSKAQEPFTRPTLGLIREVKAILNGEAPPPPSTPASTADPDPTSEPLQAGAPETTVDAEATPSSASSNQESKEALVEAQSSQPSPNETQPVKAEEAPKKESKAPEAKASEQPAQASKQAQNQATAPRQALNNAVVKVDTLKLDSLFDLVGELVIAQSLVAQDPNIMDMNNQRISRNLNQLSRIVNDLQKTVMSIRMVPIRATFQKMTRVVRDIAVKQGKKVSLTMSGEETELDRTIVDELADPLLHMVRNSIDHGIESTEERKASNKNEEGTVQLNAYHQGGNIVIEIVDDGKGLDRDKILEKAIERGLARPDEELSDDEVFKFIFNPGFSTAEQVTDISGRGVGMDVVLRNIEKLRGKIEISSAVGKGTTFSIFLPLTLAIIEGLIVKVASHKYIIPTLSVRESFRPENNLISTVHERGEMVNVRGRLLPLIRLYDFFGIQDANMNPDESIIIVIETGHQQKCVLVDELVGKQEVVIKSLGEHFSSARALSGAAILGDGQVGLILDASALELQGRN